MDIAIQAEISLTPFDTIRIMTTGLFPETDKTVLKKY